MNAISIVFLLKLWLFDLNFRIIVILSNIIGIGTKYLAWFSNINEIKWHPLEVVNSIPGERGKKFLTFFSNIWLIDIFFVGVLTSFKGHLFYFQLDVSVERIGYSVKIQNEKLEFVPLETKLPFGYCPSISEKCLEINKKNQLYCFTTYT